MTLRVNLPGPDAPGYLLRLRRTTELQRKLGEGATPELFDEMVRFLVDFVEEPADRAEAEAALWQLSQSEYEAVMNALQGGNADPNA